MNRTTKLSKKRKQAFIKRKLRNSMAAEPPIHTARIRKADTTTLIQVLFVPPVAACLNVCFASDREFKFIIQDFCGIV